MNAEATKILKKIGAEYIQAQKMIDSLNFEERKLVEVARVMYHHPEVLIVDETTTALSQKGRDKIYEIIKTLKNENKAVIFISHDLEEVESVCDTAEILRDGEYITKLEGEELSPNNMRTKMIGRKLTGKYYREDESCSWDDEIVLKVEGISWNFINNISFDLHKGEILGIGGLSECGMHELCKIVYGGIKPDSGKVTFVKNNKVIKKPLDSISNNIAYLPKDRDQESLFLSASIKDNIVVASLDDIKKGCYISPKKEKQLACSMSEKLAIKMRDVGQDVKELSGGNKQKVVVAKWLANDSQILIMDCPTRGIDIGVKSTIYFLMEKLKKEGKSIIMISEEMPELIGMSDRIIVIKNGNLMGEFRKDEVNEHLLIQKMV